MKELSIEEKAKAYDKALERAKNLHRDAIDMGENIRAKQCEIIFSELKESGTEDEKIKKVLIDYFKTYKTQEEYGIKTFFGIPTNDIIAWLEKQGEQNLTDKVEPIFNIGNTIIKKHNSDIRDFGSFTITDITGGKYWYNDRIICNITEQDEWEFYEPVRQKPVWSEEDERLCSCLIEEQEESLDNVKNDKYGHSEIISDLKDMYRERIDWLNSLKDRVKLQWKPSEEQIQALEYQVHSTYTGSWQYKASKELLEQLKKL